MYPVSCRANSCFPFNLAGLYSACFPTDASLHGASDLADPLAHPSPVHPGGNKPLNLILSETHVAVFILIALPVTTLVLTVAHVAVFIIGALGHFAGTVLTLCLLILFPASEPILNILVGRALVPCAIRRVVLALRCDVVTWI